MEYPTPTTKLHSDDTADGEGQFPTTTILGLPDELLFRVMSLLSAGSVRNLITNRPLRRICEQYLYRSISLPRHPRRSTRLLKTFLLRPDLALLVQHLEIDFSWIFPGLFPQSQVPSILRPHGLEALSLVKNIHSLSLQGVAAWIWEPELAELRKVIFEMNLVRLEVPILRDPHTEYMCVWPGDEDIEENWDGDLGDEIRRLLKAQPLLEEFHLSNTSVTYKTAASLKSRLQPSDVSNLKALQAVPHVAVAFLPLAPRLESLNLMITEWDDRLFSNMETASEVIKLSLHRLIIRVWYSDEWLWTNLAKILGLFPNAEELSIAINSLTSARDVEPAKYYFKKVADSIYILPSLRDVEVRFETLYPETRGIFEVDTESIVDFKTACPLLETLVDPEKRLWTFESDGQSSGGLVPQLVGPLIKEYLGPANDLPAPEGSES